MVFSSTVFVFAFLPITLCIYYNPFIRNRQFRNVFLLMASLFFYAWGEPVNVFLMMMCVFFGWIVGLRIQRSSDKTTGKKWLAAGISVIILVLIIFKYLTFISGQLYTLFGIKKPALNIALPIGISFFLFQLMSYLFDIYYGTAEAQKNVLNVGLYISLFPQLIAGPIVRYSDISEQISERRENFADFSHGLIRFSTGLAKKVLLANYLGVIADNIFPNTGNLSVLTSWIGAIAYSLQIYFDFSGYSDMAIGLGGMFGFRFPENFNYPYIACSVTEFWRRWHISLSSWFRDYVYIPMGGNRVSKVKWMRNLFTVWLLTGIWHGANWTFVLWGLIYFFVLIIEKEFVKSKIMPSKLRIFSHIYTMLIVMLEWVIFRSGSIRDAAGYIAGMFYNPDCVFYDETALYYLKNSKWFLIFGLILSTPLFRKCIDYLEEHRKYYIVAALNILIFLGSLVSCISSTYNPFIYFNF